MASLNPQHPKSLYPQVDDSNPTPTPAPSAPPASSLYPSVDMRDLVENLFPNTDEEEDHNHKASGDKSSLLKEPPVEETLIRVPGAILHLIDKHQSVEIGCGDFVIARLRQGENVVAVLARVADAVQWPLAKDEAAVRLDNSHYFFSLHVPEGAGAGGGGSVGGGGGHVSEEDVLNYGLTFASKGQERLLKELDGVLERYSSFSVQKVVVEKDAGGEVLGGTVASETTPEEVMVEGSKKKEVLEKEASAYWTTLAPNVEDYSSSIARLIAKGSGQLIRGILWCGDVTVDRLKWGNDVLKKRIAQKQKSSEISPAALRRIQRVKAVTKMSENVANGILSGVVKVSGFFTSSVVNSKVGKKFFGLLPGEIVLATLDGFGKICDAVEVAGKNVLSTSSTVTTGLVSHRYGEPAANATSHSMDAAGHAMGTAWAVFKIRKALNPKSVMKPTTLAKSAAKAAAAEIKGKKK